MLFAAVVRIAGTSPVRVHVPALMNAIGEGLLVLGGTGAVTSRRLTTTYDSAYKLRADLLASLWGRKALCMQRKVLVIEMDTPSPEHNLLLKGLPEDVKARLEADLVLTELPLGAVIYESGDVMNDVYFPSNSIISLLYVMADGCSAEISVVGNEGIVGIALFMGGGSTPSRGIVQSAGYAYRLEGRRLKAEFDRHGEFHRLLLRYTQALLTQMAQTAACNRHHSIHQQLCRWLLLSMDRLQGDKLDMTQELIANMLGVRREGVTAAASKLQRAGVIAYQRGHIRIIDRSELERRSCECYAVVKRETDRLLQAPRSVQGRSEPASSPRTPR